MLSTVVVVTSAVLLGSTASAQAPAPTVADSARLLGHLWADGSYDDGVWDATGPSGGSTLIEYLVEEHGGAWVDRDELRFRLPGTYGWTDWKDSLPADDAWTREAVRHPNFLAALLEGEGSVGGLVYDQSSCCTPGYREGRLTALVALLRERGFATATLTRFGDIDSGEVSIAASDFARLRRTHEFICPATATAIRVPGGEQYGQYGPIAWLGPGNQYSTLVREDCRSGVAIDPVSAPIGDCIVTVASGGRLHVTWSYPRGNVVVRRDGAFVETVSALNGSFIESRPPGRTTYTIRVFTDGVATTDACGGASSADPVELAPPGRARCAGRVVTHLGTGAADIIDGTSDIDVIHGFGGDDLLRGFGSADVICGGEGSDRLRGGYGNDILLGGNGTDWLVSGPGADISRGGNGADRIEGNRGADMLDGGVGDDVLRGGNGFDVLSGGRGADILRGGPHQDSCVGGWGVDLLARDCERSTQ